ncbi:transposase [Candidatus Hadarchaeum sp.]|uniref:transposase n=1 Tax=Candidatus Hadarchaeum sp. TaxID=2883567 RepID=UPI003857CC75
MVPFPGKDRDSLNRARKKDRKALAEGLKTVDEGKEALKWLPERWGKDFPRTTACWETKAYALLAFLRHPRPIRWCLFTTNRLELMS